VPIRRLRVVTLLVLLLAVGPVGVTDARAEQPGLVAVPDGTTAGRSRLVVALPGPGPAPSFAVTVDGTPRPVTTTPLLSDGLATALVVDASADGGPILQPGISGAVDLVLGGPAAARTALVADTDPPAVVTPLRPGPAAVVDGLSTLQPRGDRRTGAALDLAARQLPPEADSPRLLVLYTAAPDAPGRSAADLGARLSADGIVLAVVTTAGDGDRAPAYWSAAAAATGGTAVGAPGSDPVAGFTRLATDLRSRYLLTVPAPARFPAAVAVRADGPAGALATETVLPAPAVPGGMAVRTDGARSVVATVLVVVVLVLVVAAMAVAARRRGRRERLTADPVWDVPARPDPVADRPQLLAATRRALTAGTTVVLHGPTGVGTTTAMIELAHRDADDYDVVWWVAAQDPSLVKDRLAELAELLGLAGPDDTAADATDRLRDALGRADRWLLLLDDPPGPDELARLLPDGPGHVVVASTDPAWRERGTALAVPPLRRAESVDLLRARQPGLSAEDADRVAAASGDVPLALVPAASLAGADVDGCLRALSPDGGATAAWAAACDRLAVDDPAALALLTFVAWLAPHPVPLRLLTEHPDPLPPPLAATAREPDQLAQRAATLQRRGLVLVEPGGVRLHPTPAAQLRDRTGGLGWAASAVRVLRAAVEANPADRSTWRRLLPHVLAATDPARDLDEVVVDVGWLLRHAGRHLQARGESRSARALLADAHDLYRQRLGDDHPDTRAAARDLGDGSPALGRTG
jgi:hypothetical protein